MPYSLRLFLLCCASFGLYYALRRLGLGSWLSYLLSVGSLMGLAVYVQFGLGITFQ